MHGWPPDTGHLLTNYPRDLLLWRNVLVPFVRCYLRRIITPRYVTRSHDNWRYYNWNITDSRSQSCIRHYHQKTSPVHFSFPESRLIILHRQLTALSGCVDLIKCKITIVFGYFFNPFFSGTTSINSHTAGVFSSGSAEFRLLIIYIC